VYGFVGATLGPKAGVVAGWGLLGTYTFYGVVTSMASGLFGVAFLEQIGVWHDPPERAGFVVGGLALLGVLALTISPVRRGTRVLLTVEGLTVLLILLVAVVVLVRLATGSGGKHLTLAPFTVAPGTDSSTLFLGVVFGFLSFAGFEAAATLGEEAHHPRRDIPRAILGTAIFGGVYFVFVTWVEVMGFGADEAGLKDFASSGSLMGDLGTRYVGAWVGDLISLGAAVSAFGCALACAVGASRLAYALARDGVLPGALRAVHPTRRTPTTATYAVVGAMYLIIVVWALGGATPFDEFLYSGTIGTLILLVAYVLATLGAIRLVFFSRLTGDLKVARWEIVVPVLALGVLAYTIFRNVVPYPTGAAAWLPLVCAVWLLAAVALVTVRPELARRAGEALTAEEGLSLEGAATTREAER
jgi:amino acid transporter